MKTKIIKGKPTEEELEEIVTLLDQDGLIVFPTDTVYGLACNCYSKKGIEKIFQVKKRDHKKPINVLTDSLEKIKEIAYVSAKEEELIEKYMPGALTVILDKKENIPGILTAELNTVGVRIPKDDIALEILRRVPYPLATTSVNESGESAGIQLSDFQKLLEGKVEIMIDGGPSKLQVASTIIRVENNQIKVLREGSLKIEE
ncbi:MAG: threonylcarbamoyl-AMP synthase [Bacilli bacterium]|nr:threonylcarbamoyl-AMP synthase [Bacilli bacterium]